MGTVNSTKLSPDPIMSCSSDFLPNACLWSVDWCALIIFTTTCYIASFFGTVNSPQVVSQMEFDVGDDGDHNSFELVEKFWQLVV